MDALCRVLCRTVLALAMPHVSCLMSHVSCLILEVRFKAEMGDVQEGAGGGGW